MNTSTRFSSWVRLASILLLIHALTHTAFGAAGDVDLSFDAGSAVTTSVSVVVVQPDGKVLIGEVFTQVSGMTGRGIARLNANGSPDNSFNPGAGANDGVVAVARQPDGKVLIGGMFTQVNGVNKLALARLNTDGSVDTNFYPALTGLGYEPIPHPYGGEHATAVTAIRVLPDGKMLVAGCAATQITGEEVFVVYINFFLEKLNADGSHAAGFNTAVGTGNASYSYGWHSVSPSAIAIQPDGRIIVGGSFNGLNGIVRLQVDGSPDDSFVPAATGFGIYSVALQPDGKVLIGGDSFLVNRTNYTSGIVRLNANGSFDSSFNPGTGAYSVSSVALQPDGKVLIGGSFTSFNGTNRNRIARLNANGSLDGSFNPGTGADGPVRSIALQPDGHVLIGGDFRTVNGALRQYVARLYGADVAPALSISRSNGLVTVSWLSPFAGFVLQQNTNLNTSSWTTPPEPITDNGTTRTISVIPTTGDRFFRLFKP